MFLSFFIFFKKYSFFLSLFFLTRADALSLDQVVQLVVIPTTGSSPSRTGRLQLLGAAGLSHPTRRSIESEQFGEGIAEFGTEDGVQYWVESGVEVSEPEEEGDHIVVKVAIGAEGHEQCDDEEREPADDECPRDDGQCFSCFPFPL